MHRLSETKKLNQKSVPVELDFFIVDEGNLTVDESPISKSLNIINGAFSCFREKSVPAFEVVSASLSGGSADDEKFVPEELASGFENVVPDVLGASSKLILAPKTMNVPI